MLLRIMILVFGELMIYNYREFFRYQHKYFQIELFFIKKNDTTLKYIIGGWN